MEEKLFGAFFALLALSVSVIGFWLAFAAPSRTSPHLGYALLGFLSLLLAGVFIRAAVTGKYPSWLRRMLDEGDDD